MKFSEYMTTRGLKDGEMAVLLDCDRSYVLKLRSGKVPSPTMMGTIAEKTEGAVLPGDWFDDLPTRADAA